MSNITLQLPKPHSVQQEIIFKSLLTPGLKEAWFPCGSKFGKSLAASCSLVAAAFTRKDRLFRWVAPVYSQAKIGLKYSNKLIPAELRQVNNSGPSLYLPHSNCTIEFRSGKNGEDLEGEAIDGGYCLDEAAKMSEQVYNSAKTTVTVTQAPIIVFSTPRGKNWFFKKCMEAKEEMLWELSKNRTPTKIFMTAPATVNPAVKPETVAEMRRSLPDRLARQYIDAEFVDDGSIFLGYRDCYFTDRLELTAAHQIWTDEASAGNAVVVGVDWAKSEDYTVFIALEVGTKKVVGFQRFNRERYTEAVRRLVRFCDRWQVITVYHDKTGVGSAIDDQLSFTKLSYHGVIFTNSSKSQMINDLMTGFELKNIRIPYWPTLDQELESYEVSQTAAGSFVYSAPSGMHDDCVSALMLCYSAYLHHGKSESLDLFYLEDLKNLDFQPSDNELFYL